MRMSWFIGSLSALCLATGCAHNAHEPIVPVAVGDPLKIEPVVVTAEPDACAEDRWKARRAEAPVRVLCGDRVRDVDFSAGRGPGPEFRSGPTR